MNFEQTKFNILNNTLDLVVESDLYLEIKSGKRSVGLAFSEDSVDRLVKVRNSLILCLNLLSGAYEKGHPRMIKISTKNEFRQVVISSVNGDESNPLVYLFNGLFLDCVGKNKFIFNIKLKDFRPPKEDQKVVQSLLNFA